MSSDKSSEYLAYRRTIKRHLLLVGLWPNDKASLRDSLLLVIQLSLHIMSIVAIGNFVRVHSDNVGLITKGISVMSGFLTNTFKTLWFITYRKDAIKLHQMLDSKFFKLLNDPRLSSIVVKDVKTFKYLTTGLTCLIFVSCTNFVINPMISIAYQRAHKAQTIKYRLVLPVAYPWAVTPGGFLFKLHYFLEALSLFECAIVALGVDTLFGLYVLQVIGQFREMSFRITNIDEKQDYRMVVHECIEEYEVLIKCRNILQKIYGPILLWTILVNAVNLCTQLFDFSQAISISAYQAVLKCAYIMYKLLQTFIYAWAGSRFTDESANYQQAIYSARWFENRHFMTSIVIMLTQKPMVLTACNFFLITVEIFVKFLNTTISYYFLLQTLDA